MVDIMNKCLVCTKEAIQPEGRIEHGDKEHKGFCSNAHKELGFKRIWEFQKNIKNIQPPIMVKLYESIKNG